MLRFRLGPIPVEVHFQHLLFSGLFAYLARSADGFASDRWPYPYLVDSSSPLHARTLAVYVVAWMAIIFVSALGHELGHALVSRAFGYRPRIRLLWLGGQTQVGVEDVHPGVAIPWHRDVLLTLAGPAFGLLLFACSLGLLQLGPVGNSPVASYVLGAMAGANLVWAALNLIPISPLDGGHVARVVLVRLMGDRGAQVAKVLSAAIVGAGIAWALRHGQPVLAVLFALWLVRALALPVRRLRPLAAPRVPRTPTERAFHLAQQSFLEGELEPARRRCLLLVDDEETPRGVRSQAHHLLGWIALKEGQGRLALDHFSQVGESPRVEVHALAAAFSLIGDEHRALSLWELAYREAKSPTVLHEWAGAMIRAGRTEQARKLPGVDMAQAFRCAERVLAIREDFAGAARVGLAGFAERPTAQGAYDTACALARAGDKAGALGMLAKASALGFADKAYASTDSDLASLHGDAGFAAWLASLEESPRG